MVDGAEGVGDGGPDVSDDSQLLGPGEGGVDVDPGNDDISDSPDPNEAGGVAGDVGVDSDDDGESSRPAEESLSRSIADPASVIVLRDVLGITVGINGGAWTFKAVENESYLSLKN